MLLWLAVSTLDSCPRPAARRLPSTPYPSTRLRRLGSTYVPFVVLSSMLLTRVLQCSQGTHCAAGMGFAINPPASGNTITAFIAKAMAGAGSSSRTSPSSHVADTVLDSCQRNDWRSCRVRNRRRWISCWIRNRRSCRRYDLCSSRRLDSPDWRWIGRWIDRRQLLPCLILLLYFLNFGSVAACRTLSVESYLVFLFCSLSLSPREREGH